MAISILILLPLFSLLFLTSASPSPSRITQYSHSLPAEWTTQFPQCAATLNSLAFKKRALTCSTYFSIDPQTEELKIVIPVSECCKFYPAMECQKRLAFAEPTCTKAQSAIESNLILAKEQWARDVCDEAIHDCDNSGVGAISTSLTTMLATIVISMWAL